MNPLRAYGTEKRCRRGDAQCYPAKMRRAKAVRGINGELAKCPLGAVFRVILFFYLGLGLNLEIAGAG